MKCRLIWNDLKKNKLASAATFLFFAVTAVMVGLTVLLSGNLLGAVDNLLEQAETVDFLQMHAGKLEENEIKAFADSQDMVEKWQIGRFLNLNNGELSLGEASLSESTQDNGLWVQSDRFDYLLTLDNARAVVKDGEVLVPACYRKEYQVKTGDRMQIGEESLRIAGFLRDSQMNSMMASSKRFLVSQRDYDHFLKMGTEEYLIEFRLKAGSDLSAFATAYTDAKLPCNGPAVTRPLIRLMNAMSDGMMVLVILLVSVVVLVISILCIRFLLMTSLEREKAEIGMLKAIGISAGDIRGLYFTKFLLLSGLGSLAGFLAAIGFSGPMGRQIRELYGGNAREGVTGMCSLLGILLVEGVMLFSVHRLLMRMKKISAVEALRNQKTQKRRRGKAYVFISMGTAAVMFLAMVPQNLSSTIAAPEFMTCMGVGNGEIRVDVRQTEDIFEKSRQIDHALKEEKKVDAFVMLMTRSCRIRLLNGTESIILTEFGNHETFPLKYISGSAPVKNGELAISVLNAKELGLKLGDLVTVMEEGKEEMMSICGIYSDVTNGGKTAKAYQPEEKLLSGREVMWSIFYVTLAEGENRSDWISKWQKTYGGRNGGVRVTDIRTFLMGTYGQTIGQIALASKLSLGAGSGILFIVILLFVRLLLEQERRECALLKAIGYQDSAIRQAYLKKSGAAVTAGVLTGILLGIFLGKMLAGMLLGALGAVEFPFVLNLPMILLGIPGLIFITAFLAVRLALSGIRKIHGMEAAYGGR